MALNSYCSISLKTPVSLFRYLRVKKNYLWNWLSVRDGDELRRSTDLEVIRSGGRQAYQRIGPTDVNNIYSTKWIGNEAFPFKFDRTINKLQILFQNNLKDFKINIQRSFVWYWTKSRSDLFNSIHHNSNLTLAIVSSWSIWCCLSHLYCQIQSCRYCFSQLITVEVAKAARSVNPSTMRKASVAHCWVSEEADALL